MPPASDGAALPVSTLHILQEGILEVSLNVRCRRGTWRQSALLVKRRAAWLQTLMVATGI